MDENKYRVLYLYNGEWLIWDHCCSRVIADNTCNRLHWPTRIELY